MNSRPQPCAAALLETIPEVMRTIRHHMRAQRLPGMTVPQFRILGFLERRGPSTLSAAADHLGTSLPSVSRLVQSLVHRRLVQRQAGWSDRRTIRLEVTARGRRVLEAARQATVEQLAGVLAALRPGQVKQIHQALEQLRPLFAAGPNPRQNPRQGP